MTIPRSLFAAAVAVAMLSGASTLAPEAQAQQQAQQTSAAAQFVQKVGDQAILDLTEPGLGDSDRVRRMRQFLRENFDEEAVSRFVLGVYWNRASEEERREFMRLYEVLVAHTYAGLFKKYTGETFEVLRERPVDDGTIVYAQINQPGTGQAIPVELQVKNNGGYKAVDIKVEGISMPLTHRKEYASVIQRNQGKVSGLLKILREKATSLEKNTPSN